MNKRDVQREETRAKILEAALKAFSDHGYSAASTRDIANRAGVNQGLITYHFKSKEILWQQAASKIFSEAREMMGQVMLRHADADPRTLNRNMIKAYVRFVAKRPELLRFMVEEGKQASERVEWLVDTHLKPLYEAFQAVTLGDEHLKPHFFYAMTGAGSLIFAVSPLCKRLTGLDPSSEDAIEAHADFIAGMLVPAAQE